MNAQNLTFTLPSSHWSRSRSTMRPKDFCKRRRIRLRIWCEQRKDVAGWSQSQSRIMSYLNINASWSVINNSKEFSTSHQTVSSFKKNHGILFMMVWDWWSHRMISTPSTSKTPTTKNTYKSSQDTATLLFRANSVTTSLKACRRT